MMAPATAAAATDREGGNPYAAPLAASPAGRGAVPYWLYAAIFCCLNPFLLAGIGYMNLYVMDTAEGTPFLIYITIIGLLTLALMFAGPVLGIVALAWGIRRKAKGTIVLASVGLLLHVLFMVVPVVLILMTEM